MLRRDSRRGKFLGALLLSVLSLIMCAVFGVAVWLPFTTGPYGRLPVAGEAITFPPRDPCTPVPYDLLHPPIYPNALGVRLTKYPDHKWLEAMHAYSFETPDDADTVLGYYRKKMVADGWSLTFELSKHLQTSGASKYDVLSPEVANMPDVRDVQGYAAFCNTTSAHPIGVVVVVRTPDDGRTQVQLRVY